MGLFSRFRKAKKEEKAMQALYMAYDERRGLINTPKEESLNLTDTMFLGYGLDFVDYAKENFGIVLTLEEAMLPTLEKIAESAHQAYLSGQLPEERLMEFSKLFTGYLGLIILRQIGGTWVEKVAGLSENGPAIQLGTDSYIFVLSKVYRRLKNGSEENLHHFYQMLKPGAAGATDEGGGR